MCQAMDGRRSTAFYNKTQSIFRGEAMQRVEKLKDLEAVKWVTAYSAQLASAYG